MFRFSHHGGRSGGNGRHDCGPRGPRAESDPERFFHWVERLNAGERGRGGRSRRMFDGGELRLVLLKLIADEPRHGYDLIRAIEEMTGGAYAPSPGVVYPTLTLLDEMGMIEEQASEGAKKRFAATAAGRAELADKAEEVAALIARLSGIGDQRRSSPHRQVGRAMENLRNAIRGQRGEGFDPGRVERIVDILDEAARKIERIGSSDAN